MITSARHMYAPDSRRMGARHIRESDANVARTCHAQQGKLLLDPSVHVGYFMLVHVY
jgi:hypothetical protein